MSLIHEIEESPRSRDQDIDALTEPLDLFALIHSAEYNRLVESCISSIRLETLLNLDGEFTSRSDDEGLDLAFSLVRILFGYQELDNRNRECGRLASTSLSESLEVPPTKNRWDRLCLDRCRRGISLVRDGPENRIYDREFGE